MVSVAIPLVGIVTVREPVVTPNSPCWLTVTLTESGELGAGLAVSVKLAFPPSVMAPPSVMLTTGVAGDGSSLSDTATEAEPFVEET
ncbi:MAG: hypothetical protein F4Y69_11175, partial [Chloroflexi bacterium]|nr:hypothetical protein [Chloroflexota bacterium]